MPRKRKSRAIEPPQEIEPEPVQNDEPEPELPDFEETQQTQGQEDPGVGDEVAVVVEEEEEGNEEQEGEQEPPLTMEEEHNKDDVLGEKNEDESDFSLKLSENDAVLVNGGAAEGQNGEDEDEEEELEEEPLEKLLEPFSKDQLTLLIKEAVAKHPDVVQNVHKLADADPSHRKIFVHGLGWDANTESIASAFGKYGEIEDCKVVIDKNSGKSKGYGFILFKHRDGARRALKQPQKQIGNRMTSCQLASAGPVQAPPPTVVANVSASSVSDYTQRKIYVSNVSAELDPGKLLEFFSKFGEIEEGPLGLDKLTGKPRGFCLFVYKNSESAKKALDEPHKNFEGNILHCQKAIDGPKLNKGYYNQQQTQPQQQQQHQHQHHHQGHQGYYHHTAKKSKYAGGSGGVVHAGGHLMAPSSGPTVPSVGFNHPVAPAAIGQAVAALLATQGAGLGLGNLLGGIGAGVNPQGGPPMMNNVGYGGQGALSGYGGQPGMQGVYGGQPQMGQGGVRPHQGGAPYMGRGH